MSYSYSRYDRQQRRTTTQRHANSWTYWLPVGITVASAAIGLGIWAWNERRFASDDEEDVSSPESEGPYAPPSVAQGYEASAQQQASYPSQSIGEVKESIDVRDADQEQRQQEVQGSMLGRMSGAIRRTPSPQQLFDGASKRVAAGVAAAGAAMGKGLTALKESDEDFQDHERWSDEAEKQGVEASAARAVNVREARPAKKRMVCVVVSAADKDGMESGASAIEHASILSHLPLQIDSSTTDLIVLIHAPQLTSYPLPRSKTGSSSDNALRPPRTSSTASSFSNIAHEDADSDIEAPTQPQQDAYTSLQNAALRLVLHPTHVIPFTTATGHVHLLRHLSPKLVYMQEELGGPDGENVKQIEGWVGQIVLVIGDVGLGADTETEAETDAEGDSGSKSKRLAGRGLEWWQDETRVGLGKTEVVESERFEEDWMKRVGP